MSTKPKSPQLRHTLQDRKSVRKIVTRDALLKWLYRVPDQMEPRIAVDYEIMHTKKEVLKMLSEGAFIAFPPLYWPDIFSYVYWAEEENPTADRCGEDLLYFYLHAGRCDTEE